jgi:hypothetical protein
MVARVRVTSSGEGVGGGSGTTPPIPWQYYLRWRDGCTLVTDLEADPSNTPSRAIGYCFSNEGPRNIGLLR